MTAHRGKTERLAELRRLLAASPEMPVKAMAARMGISERTLMRYRRQLGVARRYTLGGQHFGRS